MRVCPTVRRYTEGDDEMVVSDTKNCITFLSLLDAAKPLRVTCWRMRRWGTLPSLWSLGRCWQGRGTTFLRRCSREDVGILFPGGKLKRYMLRGYPAEEIPSQWEWAKLIYSRLIHYSVRPVVRIMTIYSSISRSSSILIILSPGCNVSPAFA